MAAAVQSPSPVSHGEATRATLRSPHPIGNLASVAATARTSSPLASTSHSFAPPIASTSAVKLPPVELPPPTEDFLSSMHFHNSRRISITDPIFHAYQSAGSGPAQADQASQQQHPQAQQTSSATDFAPDYSYNWSSFARRMSVDRSGRERPHSPGQGGSYDYGQQASIPSFASNYSTGPRGSMSFPSSSGAYAQPADAYDYSLRRHSISQNYAAQHQQQPRLPSIDAGMPPNGPYKRKGSDENPPPTIVEEGYYGGWGPGYPRRNNPSLSYDPKQQSERDLSGMQAYEDERRGSSGSGSYSSSAGGKTFSMASPFTTGPPSLSAEYDARAQPVQATPSLPVIPAASRPPADPYASISSRYPPLSASQQEQLSTRPPTGNDADYTSSARRPGSSSFATSASHQAARPPLSSLAVSTSSSDAFSESRLPAPPLPTMSWAKQNLRHGSWGGGPHRTTASSLDPTAQFNKDGTPYARSPELRVSHKLAERKRRKEMTQLFDELKDLLPAERGAKSSKWEILSRAIVFVQNLKQYNEELVRDNNALRTHFGLGPGPKFGPSPSPDTTGSHPLVSPVDGSHQMHRSPSQAGTAAGHGTVSPTGSSFQGSSTAGPEDSKPVHFHSRSSSQSYGQQHQQAQRQQGPYQHQQQTHQHHHHHQHHSSVSSIARTNSANSTHDRSARAMSQDDGASDGSDGADDDDQHMNG